MPNAIRLGVDLGGTKLEIVALDADGRECLRRRVATPRDGYDATLAAVASLVRDAEHELRRPPGTATVGVGTPGSISRATGLLRGSNSVSLNGRPIRADLARLLARDVRITNDANCFALSEAIDGAGEASDLQQKKENFANANANGTGPFMLKSREIDAKTVLVANPRWWDKPRHNLTEVVFTPIKADATRVQDIEQEKLQLDGDDPRIPELAEEAEVVAERLLREARMERALAAEQAEAKR